MGGVACCSSFFRSDKQAADTCRMRSLFPRICVNSKKKKHTTLIYYSGLCVKRCFCRSFVLSAFFSSLTRNFVLSHSSTPLRVLSQKKTWRHPAHSPSIRRSGGARVSAGLFHQPKVRYDFKFSPVRDSHQLILNQRKIVIHLRVFQKSRVLECKCRGRTGFAGLLLAEGERS